MEEIFAILTEDLHQDLCINQQEIRLAKNGSLKMNQTLKLMLYKRDTIFLKIHEI